MTWENILKRPFDVGATQQSEIQIREQKKQKALDLFPTIFGKYFDPEFQKLVQMSPNISRYKVPISKEISDYVQTLKRHGLSMGEIQDMIKNAYPPTQRVKYDTLSQKLIFDME